MANSSAGAVGAAGGFGLGFWLLAGAAGAVSGGAVTLAMLALAASTAAGAAAGASVDAAQSRVNGTSDNSEKKAS